MRYWAHARGDETLHMQATLYRSPRRAIFDAKPTLLHAIQAALVKLSTAIGEEVVAQAVAVAGSVVASGPSADEMCWLANWCEEHAEPESITMEMANAALRHRRLRPHRPHG